MYNGSGETVMKWVSGVCAFYLYEFIYKEEAYTSSHPFQCWTNPIRSIFEPY